MGDVAWRISSRLYSNLLHEQNEGMRAGVIAGVNGEEQGSARPDIDFLARLR